MNTLDVKSPTRMKRPRLDFDERLRLRLEVEDFLYEEAALLDERRFRDWLALVTDDIHYWMPIRRTVNNSELAQEFTGPDDMAYINDDKTLLEMRLKKLESGSAWSEDPAPRSRHLVNNVRIKSVDGDEITADVSFLLYRSRFNTEVDLWVGRRTDVLRRHGEGFLLAKRHIYLDQTVIRSTNLSTLF